MSYPVGHALYLVLVRYVNKALVVAGSQYMLQV